MIGSAIKNSIIMFMIILVFHFLLKNYLYDQGLDKMEKSETKDKEVIKEIDENDINEKRSEREKENVTELFSQKQCTPQPTKSDLNLEKVEMQPTKPVEPDFSIKPNKKDILSFVLGEDDEAQNNTSFEQLKKENQELKEGKDSQKGFEVNKFKNETPTAEPNNVAPANSDGYASLDEVFGT